jgi:hypothetical protein
MAMNVLLGLFAAAALNSAAPPPEPTPVAQPFRTLAIVTPASQQTIHRDGGEVTFQFAVLPGLAEGERILVQTDDQVALLPAGTTRHVMSGVARGTHTVYAVIVNAAGDTLAVSNTIFFHMGEASVRVYGDWNRA